MIAPNVRTPTVVVAMAAGLLKNELLVLVLVLEVK